MTISKPTIGILLIATWKYKKFINSTIQGIRKYFFNNCNVKIFLHTDSSEHFNADQIVQIEHKPWPLITLFRFNNFLQNQEVYDTDYLFYLDIDVKIQSHIDTDILSDFSVVQHWYYANNRGTPETNPKSKACIFNHENITYVAGGFYGGKKEYFLKASKIMNQNINEDYDNNIIALWHDESHLNRFVIDYRKDILILPPKYLSCVTHSCRYPKIVPFRNEEKGFNKFEKSVHR